MRDLIIINDLNALDEFDRERLLCTFTINIKVGEKISKKDMKFIKRFIEDRVNSQSEGFKDGGKV